MANLPKAYAPSEHEAEMYQRWEASGYFNPDRLPKGKRAKPFVISMPPPNITGELHMGHALGMTLEDILIRYQRMRGRAALWLPGTDHAAIGTEILVKQDLRKQGVDPNQLGRERFLKKVWEWKDKYGRRIVEQVKRMGASADWSRERFTMDEGLTAAVQTAFVRLYDDGLIYRGKRIVNWCHECGTAVSDLEVSYEDIPGKLWKIRYPLADGTGQIEVATTRPETMLGDTGVAVHPDDQRYKKLIGKKVRLPISGREIPIVSDKRIEKEFGTGAVKVTPSHDPLDFEIGQAQHLPQLNVIGFDGKMTSEAGQAYAGLSVEQAREKVLHDLRTEQALVGEEDYIHAVGFCSRSKTAIEPLVSLQWFVKMEKLAGPAIDAVRKGKIKIIPERYKKTYYHWMENIRDWNVSRQIWWGHRLPVWYQNSDLRRENPKVSLKKPGPSWIQDNDTLDTWFSSGLWTFSTLGWPNRTADLKRFHPTDVMETGWDILFFWVARMIMMSLYFNQEIPFKAIYLHGLVLDEDGKKMSKSKGTGIDPLPIADKYGMDALRMSLVIGNAPGQDFRLFEKKIEGYRNFANKLWNIGRFVLAQDAAEKAKPNTLADRWILWRLGEVTEQVTTQIDDFEFSAAGQELYDFVWHDFADWYLEVSKVWSNPALARDVYQQILKLAHPFMPFITERLWQEFGPKALLIVQPWPKADTSWKRYRAQGQAFEELKKTVAGVRNFSAHSNQKQLSGVYCGDIDESVLMKLTGVDLRKTDRLTPVASMTELVFGSTRFQFPKTAVGAYESWREKERQQLERYRGGIAAKLANEKFLANAPASVVTEEREKLAEVERRLLEL